jgi:signal transduction histidine kinase
LAVAEELDPKRAARTVVDQARRVLGADGVLLWELTEGKEQLQLLAHRGVPAAMMAKLRAMPFTAPTLSSRAAASGRLQVQEDMREAAPELEITRELAQDYGFRSIVAIPLKARGRLVGVMTYMTKMVHHFSAEQLEVVTAIGRIFAIGLDNAKAYARERELRSEVQAIVASSPEGIILLEAPTGRAILSNEATESILGRPIMTEARISDYVHLYGLRQPNGALPRIEDLPPARAFRGQTVLGVQMLVQQPSGRAVPVLVSAAPVRDASGNVVAAVVLFQDISRLKELEREREEMASIIAHDLRAPLAVISGYIQFLIERAGKYGLPHPARQALQGIQSSTKSLDRLVSDLLEVARLEARRVSIRRQWVDLPVLAHDLVARLSTTIPTHNLRIEVRGELPRVWADPARVEQILTNLLTNAAKYSSPGTDILIRLRRLDGEVEVSVADRGPGIPPRELAHIFDRYYRVRSAETRAEGLGLGLYITKGLVELMGGRIWAVSRLGVGSTFHFTLPTSAKPARRRGEPREAGKRPEPMVREVVQRELGEASVARGERQLGRQ